MVEFVRRTLAIAHSKEGPHRPLGEKDPSGFLPYLKACEVPISSPWQIPFLVYCVGQAAQEMGIGRMLPPLSSCRDLALWADSQGLMFEKPMVGDIFFSMRNGKEGARASHAGFVDDLGIGSFATVEPNIHLEVTLTSIGVFSKNRLLSGDYRYFRWWTLEGTMSWLPGAILTPTVSAASLLVDGSKAADLLKIGGIHFAPIRRWGAVLGLKVEWDTNHQQVVFDGIPFFGPAIVLSRGLYAPINDLTKHAGLKYSVDGDKVTLVRATT